MHRHHPPLLTTHHPPPTTHQCQGGAFLDEHLVVPVQNIKEFLLKRHMRYATRLAGSVFTGLEPFLLVCVQHSDRVRYLLQSEMSAV